MDLLSNDKLKDIIYKISKSPNFYVQFRNENIPYDFLKQLSSWHNLSTSEKIEIAYYESIKEKGNFFNAEKVYHFSTCITASGISFSAVIESKGWAKGDDAFIKINWEEIEKVSFSENVDLEKESSKSNTFFISNDPSVNIRSTVDILSLYSVGDHSCLVIPDFYLKNVRLISEFLNELLFVEKEFTNDINDKKSFIENEIQELLNNNDYVELLSFLDENSDLINPIKIDYLKTIAYTSQGNLNKAENHYHNIKNAYDRVDKNSNEYQKINSYYLLSRAEIKKARGESYESAVNFILAQEIEQSKESKDYGFIKSLERKSNESYNNYVTNFFDYSYNERKVITISNNKLFKGELTSVLNINNLPAIQFPSSHPQVDETYVCHPHNNSIYIPLANYEKELLDDRINEYCYLLQCLGATSIRIVNINSEKTNSVETEIEAKKVGLDVSENAVKLATAITGFGAVLAAGDKGIGLGDDTGTNHRSSTSKLEDLNSSLEKIQYFNPTKPPYVPTNLTWFKQELSWQRIAQQRLDGNLLNHNEYITNKQNQVINHTEFNKLNLDLNLLIASSSIKKTNLDKYQSTLDINEEWRIEVAFKPIEEFQQLGTQNGIDTFIEQNNKIISLTENEQNYLEEILFILEDSLEITDKEETFLKRFKQRFNISDARDIELREIAYDTLQPKLTEDEVEYIEDLKNIIGDNLLIDEKTRKTLNKLARLLDISETRMLELEDIYFNSIRESS